jgi:hypothetical protein
MPWAFAMRKFARHPEKVPQTSLRVVCGLL